MRYEVKVYRFYWEGQGENLIITTPHQLEEAMGEYVVIHQKGGWLTPSDFEPLDLPLQVVIALKEALGHTICGENPIEQVRRRKGRKK